MGTETFAKKGQVSKKVKKHRGIKQERLERMGQPADIGTADPYERQFSNNYSVNRRPITEQMEFDF